MTILVINGPNLNILGKREIRHYGSLTLKEINSKLDKQAKSKNVKCLFFQSNHEGAIIDRIQQTQVCDGILINPAAYTHTSIAIRDALLAMNKPFVEVHLTDILSREAFRHHSFFSDIALATVMGRGADSYVEGFVKLVQALKSQGHLSKIT